MGQPLPSSQPPAIAPLLAALEECSRARPDRVLRLRGQLPVNEAGEPDAAGEALEPFELLIFRGFSSSTTHPTAFDPDRPALPEGARIESAELLAGPLDPTAETVLAGPVKAACFLRSESWA
ncbi:MAG: hypothetical protein ACKO6F_07440 [Cyanobium sp.]